jgi:hypothetical protein
MWMQRRVCVTSARRQEKSDKFSARSRCAHLITNLKRCHIYHYLNQRFSTISRPRAKFIFVYRLAGRNLLKLHDIYLQCYKLTVTNKFIYHSTVFFQKISHSWDIWSWLCFNDLTISSLISVTDIRMHPSKCSSVRRIQILDLTVFIKLNDCS